MEKNCHSSIKMRRPPFETVMCKHCDECGLLYMCLLKECSCDTSRCVCPRYKVIDYNSSKQHNQRAALRFLFDNISDIQPPYNELVVISDGNLIRIAVFAKVGFKKSDEPYEIQDQWITNDGRLGSFSYYDYDNEDEEYEMLSPADFRYWRKI